MRLRQARPAAPPAPPSWWKKHVGAQVIVHQKAKDAASVRGIVVGALDEGFVLAHAVLLPDEGPEVPMAGEQWLPREGVAFAQSVPSEGDPALSDSL